MNKVYWFLFFLIAWAALLSLDARAGEAYDCEDQWWKIFDSYHGPFKIDVPEICYTADNRFLLKMCGDFENNCGKLWDHE